MREVIASKDYQWNVRGESLYALWCVGRTTWTREQQDFIDARVTDIFDVDQHPTCECGDRWGRPCNALAITLGYRQQGCMTLAVRECLKGHRYTRYVGE